MQTVTFDIPIRPRPSNQRNAAIVGGHARVVQSKDVRAHQDTITALTAQFRPRGDDGKPITIEGPIRMDLCAVFEQRKTTPKKFKHLRQAHISRPDRDNILKSLQDGMRDWYKDDSQVFAGEVCKVYGAEGESAHYHVRLSWGGAQWLPAPSLMLEPYRPGRPNQPELELKP